MARSNCDAMLETLNELKNMAIETGYITCPEKGMAIFKKFYKENNMAYINESGQVMEIIVCFILGMIKRYFESAQREFWVEVSDKLDRRKIDFQVNNISFQQKFDWDKLSLELLQEQLIRRNIKVIDVPNSTKRADRDIIDVISDILSAAGFLSDEISDLVDNAAALDAGYEIWSDYCEGITLEKDKKIKN